MYLEEKRSGEVQHPSLTGFIQWLEQQPKDKTYFWCDLGTCACGQYADAVGLGKEWRKFHKTNEVWHVLNALAHSGHWSFGDLLQRAKA